MTQINEAAHGTDGVDSGRPERPSGGEAPPRRMVIDKRTHRVRLESETESEVTVVIEKKGWKG